MSLNFIAEKTGCEIDPRVSDISNYTVTKYEAWHLGSRGQRTGLHYVGADDFTLIEPNFKTSVVDPLDVAGSINDFFINTKPLQKRDFTTRYIYDDVLGGGAYLGHYVNLESVNDVRVLIITDSFAKAVNPYLIMGFGEFYSTFDGFVGDITPKFISAYDPDVVIMMYYPQYLNSNSGSFDFSGF